MENEDLTILLIEDQEADILLFTEILADTSYSAHKLKTAGRMSQALDILEEQRIDIVVLDLHLPDSRGLETFIKITESYPEIPAIIYTVTDDEDIALDAIRKGADDYLIKGPYLDTVQVEKSIRKAVETSKSRTVMQQTMQDLKRTNEYLEHFAYVASHDLNAPLINLEELQKIVDLEGKPVEFNARIFHKMSKSIGRLRATLNSLFRVLEVHQKLDDTLEDISLEEIMKKVMQDLSADITALEAVVQHDFTAASRVKFPPEHLYEVLKQLVANALRYHRKNVRPEIMVRSSLHESDYICVEVEDNGIGFGGGPQQHRIFSLFNRPHKSSSGHGIGLYTVKTLVENQNGLVSARNKEHEPGSVFQVLFNKFPKNSQT